MQSIAAGLVTQSVNAGCSISAVGITTSAIPATIPCLEIVDVEITVSKRLVVEGIGGNAPLQIEFEEFVTSVLVPRNSPRISDASSR